VWARKNTWGRLGIDVLHLSLIIVLVGGLVGGVGGFEDFQVAHKGETFKVANGGFDVRIDDLWSSSYKDSSQIKDWYTKLTIMEDGREVTTKTIEVNTPITYKGISFYQASFGSDWMGKAELTFRVERSNQSQDKSTNTPDNPQAAQTNSPSTPTTPAPITQEITATVGSEFTLDESKRKVRIVAFYPDLVMSEQGPVNRSQRLNNPAAFLEIYSIDKPDKPEFSTWTFAQFPEFQHEFAKENPYRFFLAGMKAPEFTGLQIAYNPGIGLIYLGFAMMMLGLCMNFYMPPRRLWVDVKDNHIYLGGLGRDPREFEPEFEEIVHEYNQKIRYTSVPTVSTLVGTHL
jgi:cytochrome c biogenesis protein